MFRVHVPQAIGDSLRVTDFQQFWSVVRPLKLCVHPDKMKPAPQAWRREEGEEDPLFNFMKEAVFSPVSRPSYMMHVWNFIKALCLVDPNVLSVAFLIDSLKSAMAAYDPVIGV